MCKNCKSNRKVNFEFCSGWPFNSENITVGKYKKRILIKVTEGFMIYIIDKGLSTAFGVLLFIHAVP
jgi:hypothetical protein